MHAEKILYPTDFSTANEAGLAMATALARGTGAKLIILHVEEPPMQYGAGEMYYGIPNPDTAEVQSMLKAIKPTDDSVVCEHRLVTGDPASEIVRVAEEEDVDLIVLGTHGRTGLKRLLMGSVAEAVVRRAACPVISFKPGDKAIKWVMDD